MKLTLLTQTFAICKLGPKSEIPDWALQSDFFSISRTNEELSIVCEQALIPISEYVEKNWRLLKVQGPLDFSLTGILSSIANPLAEEKISIFAISTFNTDYIMVKNVDLDQAIHSLKSSGFQIS